MNDEQEVIMSLYRDGKITEAQKNALLAAIGVETDDATHVEARADGSKPEPTEKKRVTFNIVGMENPYDASRISPAIACVTGVKKATASITRGEVAVTGDFDADAVVDAVKRIGFTCKPVGVEYVDESDADMCSEPAATVADKAEGASDDIFGGDSAGDKRADTGESKQTLSEKLSGLGKKITVAIKSGFDSLGEVEEKISRYFDDVLYGENGEVVVKSKPEAFETPYERMTITVKIINAKGVMQFTEKGKDVALLKRECAAVMSDAAFDALNELLEKRFTGKYKYECGGDIFKLGVKP